MTENPETESPERRPMLRVKVKRTVFRLKPKEYERKGFYIVRRGKRIYIPPTVVRRKARVVKRKGFVALRPDIGTPGRGKKVTPPLKKGLLTKIAQEMGYEKTTDVPREKIPELGRRMVDKFGAKRAFSMAQVQVLFRKRLPDGTKAFFEDLRDYIGRTYAEELTPRKAVAKWKAMPEAARKRAMPERKEKPGYVKKIVVRRHWKTGKPYRTAVWVKAVAVRRRAPARRL